MTRKLPTSIYKRINSKYFKSDPYNVKNSKRYSLNHERTHETPNHTSSNEFVSHSAIKIHPVLKYALNRNKSIYKLNEMQESSYLSILSGKDVTIHSPTGSGKTIAYLLPILNNIYQIHDMLEDLILRDSTIIGDKEDRLKRLSLGWNKRVPHALLPSSFDEYKQDTQNLEALGSQLFNKYPGRTTFEKLVDVLVSRKPSELKSLSGHFHHLPYHIWRKKSRNSVYRNLMSNPLGGVRCVVILVPGKDLVSQVIRDIYDLDYLGRVSVQALTRVHYLPLEPEGTIETLPKSDDHPFYPSQHTFMAMSDEIKIPSGVLSLEDQKKMLQNVPTRSIDNDPHTYKVETVAINMGNKKRSIILNPLSTHGNMKTIQESYGVDGLEVQSVEHKRQPLIVSPRIQWGSTDIVVTTPQLFLMDILQRKQRRLYPVCVVFDEVDMLFESGVSRSSIMEIVSYLRPRPPSYNPLVDSHKVGSRQPPPCQFIKSASTIAFGGMQTSGSMIYERFGTSKLLFSDKNHLIKSEVTFIKFDDENDKLELLIKSIVSNPVPKTVIFANSLKNVSLIYNYLKEHKWPVLAFHSRSTLATRVAMIKTFFDGDDDPRIFVATDLLARGIDLKTVHHIINFDFPNDASVFLHRIKSQDAKVTSLVGASSNDLSTQIRYFQRTKKPINQILSRKRSFRRKIKSLNLSKPREFKDGKREREGPVEITPTKPLPPRTMHHTEDDIYKRLSLKRRVLQYYNNYNS
ncbi:DEAD box ATP-dependent RNA helicase family member protein [Theileria equi strain WA]|uniref:ATP-dependent RNA helicase n=1 Tax=Theileria equi strain WA TaxID=1537102 RepID=L0B1Y4_THEEQ|nr:DEAD box ATP-dependent RNA helicase family member protein [Theileria equi strain WA]AFZ81256.1 DEAD box ATP-dependent RNA helicase family member protein [Theileria equi strain WA]|eukprot:XP_004830922.1 DEAD box ATP-dependent RNA helicase family member protein [Theileria equi strain WA]